MPTSPEAFHELLPLVSALLGGFLSYQATASVERWRWRREKRDRLAKEKREALGQALDWLEPLGDKVIIASAVAGAALQGAIDSDEIHNKWPGGFGEMSQPKLPRRLLALLPIELYHTIVDIQLQVFQLLPKAIACSQSRRAGQSPIPGYQDAFDSIERLEKSFEALKVRMDTLYRESFD
jgi:hypothetical protein